MLFFVSYNARPEVRKQNWNGTRNYTPNKLIMYSQSEGAELLEYI
uniref:Uncharacterized protein n=1 Tax=Moniliophthora roreri TaxID=221103 RepID=A0A0W0FB48_MONRR